MSVRVREVGLGLGRDSLQSGGPAAVVQEMPPVRPTLLAHGSSRSPAACSAVGVMTWSTHAVLAAIHILAAAAWFGAMFYSLAVLHPRARAFFETPSRLEAFLAFIATGARWKVLCGCFVIAMTGIILVCLRGS